MSFKFDENNVGIKPLEAGEYEVYPNAYSKETARSGNEMFQFNYFVRDDVNQPGAGQEIRFDNFVLTANSQWRFNSLSQAVGTPNGYDFGSPQGWAQAMMGKPVRVVVEMEKDRNDKEWPRVRSFKPSQVPMNVQPVFKQNKQESVSNAANNLNNRFPSSQSQNNQYGQQNQQGQQNFGQPDPFQNNGNSVDISDDDLPF